MSDRGIQIIDNALGDPTALRIQALAAPFEDLELEGDGVYPRSCKIDIPELIDAVQRNYPRPLTTVGTGFRLCFNKELPQTGVHTDDAYGTISAILYLTLPDHCQGGTAFWRHLPSGLESSEQGQHEESRDEDCPAMKDRTDPDKWGRSRLVKMAFNRLVIFPSNRFHSRWPWEAFGDGYENGRLTAVGFFKEATPEISIRPAEMGDMEYILKSGREFTAASGFDRICGFDYKSLAISAQELMSAEDAIFLIARLGEKRVGGIAARLYPMFFNHGYTACQEQFWWVAPEHRKLGVGRALLGAVEKEAGRQGPSVVIMSSLLGTPELGKSYEKAGYIPMETLYYLKQENPDVGH